MYKFVRWLLCFIIPFLLDRITKAFIIKQSWKLITLNDYCNIYITSNRGIAWGLGSEMSHVHAFWLNIFIGIVLIYFIGFMYVARDDAWTVGPSLLILAGGVSNFLDRLWYGSVVDFIQLHIHDWFFPVFNIADISITIGGFLLLYGILKKNNL